MEPICAWRLTPSGPKRGTMAYDFIVDPPLTLRAGLNGGRSGL